MFFSRQRIPDREVLEKLTAGAAISAKISLKLFCLSIQREIVTEFVW